MKVNIDQINLELARKVAINARKYLSVLPNANHIHIDRATFAKIKEKARKDMQKTSGKQHKSKVTIDGVYIKRDSRLISFIAVDSE